MDDAPTTEAAGVAGGPARGRTWEDERLENAIALNEAYRRQEDRNEELRRRDLTLVRDQIQALRNDYNLSEVGRMNARAELADLRAALATARRDLAQMTGERDQLLKQNVSLARRAVRKGR